MAATPPEGAGDAPTMLTPPPFAMAYGKDLPAGVIVGEYEIEAMIGEGGMGRVYSALHPVIGKRAAVKVLRPELSANEDVVARFVQEARAVNKIGHPNIVDIFSFGTLPDGRSYFVMEHLKGESLEARLKRRDLTSDELCYYLDAITRALDAAHAQSIIHRDLKPENVFLHDNRGERPQLKLLDFGIAKLTSDKGMDRTRTGAMMGTPKYISPEQARGYNVDPRADVYSLGVMMFEMFTGRLPFVADNAMDLVAMHLHEEPPAPSSVVAGFPKALDRLIVAMLAKEVHQRPSLAQVRQVLESVRGMLPAHLAAGVASPRRSRIALAAGGIVVAAIASFVIVRAVSGEESAVPPVPVIAVPPPPIVVTPRVPVAEPPPVTAREPTGTLAIKRGRRGELFVDGTSRGVGPPWELELPAGRHELKLKPKSGRAQTGSVTVRRDERAEFLFPPLLAPRTTQKQQGFGDEFMDPGKGK